MSDWWARAFGLGGIGLAAIALVWQAATWRLASGRLKVSVDRRVLMGDDEHQADPVVIVQVRNVGRMPVVVQDVELREVSKGGAHLWLKHDTYGQPTTPTTIEPGGQHPFVFYERRVAAEHPRGKFRGAVTTGAGRTYVSKGTITVAPSSAGQGVTEAPPAT